MTLLTDVTCSLGDNRSLSKAPAAAERPMKTFPLLLLMIVSIPPALASNPASPVPAASPRDLNKTVARRVFEDIFHRGDFKAADQIYAPDFVNHGVHRDASLEEDLAAARWEKTVLPDLTITVDLITADQDLVTVVWTARGTNTGRAGWFPATGARVELRGITVWRIANGKIREEWTSFDLLRVVRQLLAQLKWRLLGLLCTLVIVLWLVGRIVRKILIASWARIAPTNS